MVEDLAAPPALEPTLREAVADLDAKLPSPAPAAAVEPTVHQEPRRRSTVREPAPTMTGSSETAQPAPVPPATPSPQPAITEIGESEQADKPRRSGWWSRRIAGG
jgi:ribonuclease E